MPRFDFTLARVDEATVTAVEGGHELSTTVWAPRVDGDRLCHFAAVAAVRETYAGWDAQDFQRANLTLHRKARATIRELSLTQFREHD